MADRNGGVFAPMSDCIASAVAFKCHSSPGRVRKVWDFATVKAWIVCDPLPRLRNYAKYHPTRKLKETEAGVDNLPSVRPSVPSVTKEQIQASPASKKTTKGKEPWRPFADRIYALDTERFKRIAAFINWAKDPKQNYSDKVIANGLEKLEFALKHGYCNGDWWGYAEKLIHKAYVEWQQGDSEREKQANMKFIASTLKAAVKNP